MARHGKTKARGKRGAMADTRIGRNSRLRADGPHTEPSPHRLTMQQEARNTETHHRWWGSSLRHKAVQFVSAGELPPTEFKDRAETRQAEPELRQAEPKTDDEAGPNNDAEETLFFLDSTGQQVDSTGFPDPKLPSDLSAAASSSEDEVVFTGRKILAHQARFTNDRPICVETVQDEPREILDITAAEFSPRVTPAITATVQPDQSFDLTPKSNAKPRMARERSQKVQEDDELIADYIANIDSDYYEDDAQIKTHHKAEGGIEVDRASVPPDSSDLRSAEPRIESSESPLQHSRTRVESEADVQGSIHVLARMDLDAEHDSTSTSDEDEQDGENSDEDLDLDSDDNESDLEDMDILFHEASGLTKSQHKKGRRAGNSPFPSASAFADALESDPFYGFDILDFNRPSLRQKSRGKQPELDWLVSDSEIEMELEEAWQNDRKKKKMKKKEREELRAQGLLGRNAGNPDLKAKYTNGMNMEELITELRSFLLSSKSSLSLPSMTKQRRKLVHELANTLNLKSQSRGNGPARFPILHKTSRTPGYTPKTIFKVDQLLSGRKLNRRMFNSWGSDMPKSSKAKRAAVSYMDGDVVGASAPEIGTENRGRAMLEKMGWSSGSALGATNNKGILLPVAHVVKNTRAGLG